MGDWTMEKVVGVQRYALQILNVIDNMLLNGEIHENVELVVPQNSKEIPNYERINIVKIGIISNKFQKHAWQQIVFPTYVKRSKGIGVDLTAGLPVWGCKICAIHDCIQESYPDNFLDHKLFIKLLMIKRKIITSSNKKYIVTLTEDSKKEILKYYPNAEERVSIVSCGWEHMKYTGSDMSIFNTINLDTGDKFFFSLGSKYKHKNFKWVIEAAKVNKDYKFVITGTGIYSDNENELKKTLPTNVIFTGYISNEQIKALMQKCVALIQPSYYEGFGLPPLEALSVGARIIVSNRSSLPEIYGDTAYYIDPDISGINIDDLLKSKVSNPQAVLEKYTWENAARQLIDVINKVR